MFTIGKCLCFFLLGLFFSQTTFPIEKKTPQIVFLNGPSSSGKTTLAKQLQEKFSERFLYLSFDQIIEMMPEKVNSWDEFANPVGFSSIRSTDSLGKPVTHMQIGSFGKKMRDLFRVICVSIVRNGQSLIIDDVFFEKFGEKLWKEALQEFHVIWIGLHAPLSVLEKRECIRNDRAIGSARNQFYNANQNTQYDLHLDTSISSPGECAQLIKERFF